MAFPDCERYIGSLRVGGFGVVHCLWNHVQLLSVFSDFSPDGVSTM